MHCVTTKWHFMVCLIAWLAVCHFWYMSHQHRFYSCGYSICCRLLPPCDFPHESRTQRQICVMQPHMYFAWVNIERTCFLFPINNCTGAIMVDIPAATANFFEMVL